MQSKRLASVLALLAIMALFLPSLALAQNIVTGGISGTVTDPSGAVVPNAKVSLKNSATGETQSTNTTSTGLYNFPLLKPGPTRSTSANPVSVRFMKPSTLRWARLPPPTSS